MTRQTNPDIIFYLCKNCHPAGKQLPIQWVEAGLRVRIKEVPCSGKIDARYIFHALESGMLGVCVVTCPKGECTLTQGNYRAEVRINTVRRLLEEIGSDPGRAVLLRSSSDDPLERLRELLNETVRGFSTLVGV
jgi:coenzyme F420-reducing hydrogenase delta subunit